MDLVEKFFHMTGGSGATSYEKNSALQKNASDTVKHITLQILQQLYLELNTDTVCIADLGCSSGSNSLATIKGFVQTVEGTCRRILRPPPEFHIYLNDRPTNDFNSVFMALPDFYRELEKERSDPECPSNIYIGGYPGSFYGRLFPNNSLHFIYSSLSVHWLSKVPSALYDEQGEPLNKGSIYISESSPPVVSQAYLKQFQDDFSLFLRSRSEELIVGGRMVLIMLGRVGQDHVDRGNSFFWELLSRSLTVLVSQGDIKKEKLDTYDVNFYAPSKDEIEEEVKQEGSFQVDQLEMFPAKTADHGESYGSMAARASRAVQESMIRHHFGLGEESLNSLFEIYGRLVDEELAKEEIKAIHFAIVLRKL